MVAWTYGDSRDIEEGDSMTEVVGMRRIAIKIRCVYNILCRAHLKQCSQFLLKLAFKSLSWQG